MLTSAGGLQNSWSAGVVVNLWSGIRKGIQITLHPWNSEHSPSPNYLTFADAPRWILDYTRVTSIVVRIALSWNVLHWYCYRKHFFHCNYDVIWFPCSVLTQALLRYSSTGVPLWHLRVCPHLKGMHCVKSRAGAKQQIPHLSGYLPLNYLLALTCFYSRGCESSKELL